MMPFKLTSALLMASFVLAGCHTMPHAQSELATPHHATAKADSSPTMLAPMVEKRETLIGTGYAVIPIQNHQMPAQQRLLAIRASKLDAYRSLAEQVYGQYLDANTTVADMTVLSDNFRAKVEGVIYGAVLVSINPVGQDTYETTLSLDKSIVNELRALYLSQMGSKRSQ